MNSTPGNSQFETAFSKLGIFPVPPDEEVLATARQLEYTSDREIALLQEMANAVSDEDLVEVQEDFAAVQEVYDDITVLLEEIKNPDARELAAIFDAKITEAKELLQDLQDIKQVIITKLTSRTGLNNSSDSQADLQDLPTDEVSSLKPLLLTYDAPAPSGNRDTEVVGPYSDLETQQPGDGAEASTLALFQKFQMGSREALMRPEGGVKPLKQIKKEIADVLSLAGYNRGQAHFIFKNYVNKVVEEIVALNANLVLLKKEKSFRLDAAYDQLLAIVTDRVKNSTHRFKRDLKEDVNPTKVTDSISDEPAAVSSTPSESMTQDQAEPKLESDGLSFEKQIAEVDWLYVSVQGRYMEMVAILRKIGITESAITKRAEEIVLEYTADHGPGTQDVLDAKTALLKEFTDILSAVSLVSIKNPDGEVDSGWSIQELDGAAVLVSKETNQRKQSIWVSLADLKELNSTTKSSPDNQAEVEVFPSTVRLDVRLNVEPDKAAHLAIDKDALAPAADPGTLAVIEKISPQLETSYEAEKEKLAKLRQIIEQNNLHVQYYYDLERADRHAEIIDYVKDKSGYKVEKQERRIKQNTEALAAINERLTTALADYIPVPAATDPEPDPKPLAAVTLPVLNDAVTPKWRVATPVSSMSTPYSVAAPAIGTDLDPAIFSDNAAWRKSVGLSAERPVDELHPQSREWFAANYRKERAKALHAKEVFKAAESEYQTKLKDYYENRSILNKVASGTKAFFGGGPKLPTELVELKAVYKHTRREYAKNLNDALQRRSGASQDNIKFDDSSDTTKQAFGIKFVLRPRVKEMMMQEAVFLEQEKNSHLKPIMAALRKNKTPLRVFGFGVAATVGALAGGIPLSILGATRWVASTFGGAAAAEFVYRKSQFIIDIADRGVVKAEQNALTDFSVADLDELDQSIERAHFSKNRQEMERKAATVLTAIAIGGTASIASAEIGNVIGNMNSGNSVGLDSVDPEGAKPVADEVAVREKARIAKIRAAVEEINKTKAAENLKLNMSFDATPGARPTSSLPLAENLPDYAPTGLEKPLFQLGKVEVNQYNPDGTLGAAHKVEGIELRGIKGISVPDAKANEIMSYMKICVNDIIAGNPHITKVNLEKQLFNQLQNVYAAESWWNEAKISDVKIGAITSSGRSPLDSAAAVLDKVSPPVKPSLSVQAEALAPEMGLDEGESLLVADAKKDITQILPDSAIIDSRPNTEMPLGFRKSGMLQVGMDANETESLPIIRKNLVYQPEPALSEGFIHDSIIKPEAALPSSAGLPPVPEPFSVSGNFADTPEYNNYIEENVPGGLSGLSKLVTREVSTFDNETYDFIEKFTGAGEGYYVSPYTYFGAMTLEQIDEVRRQIAAGAVEINNNGEQLTRDSFNGQGQMKYETYLAWMDKIDQLKQTHDWKPTTRLNDLFLRAVAEDYLAKTQANVYKQSA